MKSINQHSREAILAKNDSKTVTTPLDVVVKTVETVELDWEPRDLARLKALAERQNMSLAGYINTLVRQAWVKSGF